MLSDDAGEDGACLARNSLFTLVLKTYKLHCSGDTLAGRAFHSLDVHIGKDEPNELERLGDLDGAIVRAYLCIPMAESGQWN